MTQTQSFDLVVIGGGPAGYVGAIRAAQLGLRTACVERDQLGGICNNWGCIPTKALLAGAELYHRMTHEAEQWGISADNIRHDWSKVIARSRGVADTGAKGVGTLFKKNKIEHFAGSAKITAPGKVQVTDADGKQIAELAAKNILIATGAVPRQLPGADFDGERIISFKQAMSLPQQPKSLLVVGSGAIGMEFAYFYNAFGTQVTVIEMLDRLLPVEDDEISKEIARAFKKQGITCHTSHVTTAIQKTPGSNTSIKAVIAPVNDKEKTQTLEADKVLVAIGVKGNYAGLFDASLGIETFKDHIKVDYRKRGATYETSVKGIYAVGDVIGPPWLAHVASEEAIICVERLAGHTAPDIDYNAIPGCTYCHPQVASVGLTERAAREQNLDVTVGKFPFLASGKARALGETAGFVKIIADKKYGQILGCHMIGDNVTELIAELSLALRLEATVDDVIATIHAHPTLSEAVHEATLGAEGRMIHL
ncbi:MAG: dihydrolipoyl dehydrogenase [Phycisphaeraceae bacterium]|nr:dihydrolipoyl dehydrogenase [Phycisphaeraceae bacterium]